MPAADALEVLAQPKLQDELLWARMVVVHYLYDL